MDIAWSNHVANESQRQTQRATAQRKQVLIEVATVVLLRRQQLASFVLIGAVNLVRHPTVRCLGCLASGLSRHRNLNPVGSQRPNSRRRRGRPSPNILHPHPGHPQSIAHPPCVNGSPEQAPNIRPPQSCVPGRRSLIARAPVTQRSRAKFFVWRRPAARGGAMRTTLSNVGGQLPATHHPQSALEQVSLHLVHLRPFSRSYTARKCSQFLISQEVAHDSPRAQLATYRPRTCLALPILCKSGPLTAQTPVKPRRSGRVRNPEGAPCQQTPLATLTSGHAGKQPLTRRRRGPLPSPLCLVPIALCLCPPCASPVQPPAPATRTRTPKKTPKKLARPRFVLDVSIEEKSFFASFSSSSEKENAGWHHPPRRSLFARGAAKLRWRTSRQWHPRAAGWLPGHRWACLGRRLPQVGVGYNIAVMEMRTNTKRWGGCLSRRFRRVMAAVVAAGWTLAVVPVAAAQQEVSAPEAGKAWLQWLCLLGIAGLCCGIAFKNPKRSHMG